MTTARLDVGCRWAEAPGGMEWERDRSLADVRKSRKPGTWGPVSPAQQAHALSSLRPLPHGPLVLAALLPPLLK